jgi:hypothetical protein
LPLFFGTSLEPAECAETDKISIAVEKTAMEICSAAYAAGKLCTINSFMRDGASEDMHPPNVD